MNIIKNKTFVSSANTKITKLQSHYDSLNFN